MTSGLQAVIGKLRDTAKAATRVADGLRDVDCADALPDGDAGMPGGRCVAKLAAVKQGWHGSEQGFVTQLDSHAENVGKAADLYSSNEDAASHDLSTAPRSTGGPKAI
jgi:hypothetical protein